MENKLIINEAAKRIAIEAHGKQRNQYDGELYLNHVQRVVDGTRHTSRLFGAGRDSEVYMAVAWLHDVVEDTEFTLEDLRSRMSIDAWDCPINPVWKIDFVISAVDLLTKIPDEPNVDYYNRMQRTEHTFEEGARIVKVADLLDNFRRVHKIEDETVRERLARKYSLGLDMLLPW